MSEKMITNKNRTQARLTRDDVLWIEVAVLNAGRI